MKKAQLSGSLRKNVGKKDSSSLRREGRVPCVLYGSGEQVHFSVRAVDIHKIIFSPDVYRIELDIEGKKVMSIIQDKQMHPVRDTAVHIDFLELNDQKDVKVNLPIRTKGSSIGVMNGGKLRQPYRMLKVVGLPNDIPEEIMVDISLLKIGDSIRVSELDLQAIKIDAPENAVVIAVKTARNIIEEEVELEEESGEEGGEETKDESSSEESAEKSEEKGAEGN